MMIKEFKTEVGVKVNMTVKLPEEWADAWERQVVHAQNRMDAIAMELGEVAKDWQAAGGN